MTTEMVPATAPVPDVVDYVTDPVETVRQACERARRRLRSAVERDEIDRIVAIKAQAATMHADAKRRLLGAEATLAAAEMQRRCERALAQVIRRGQQNGTIETHADARRRAARLGQRSRGHQQRCDGSVKARTRDFASVTELSSSHGDIFDLCDDVPHATFEAALDAARRDGNLSRTHVVRRIRGVEPPESPRPGVLRKTHHHQPERIVAKTVEQLEGLCMGLGLLDPEDFACLDPDEAGRWERSMRASVRHLNQVRKELTKWSQQQQR